MATTYSNAEGRVYNYDSINVRTMQEMRYAKGGVNYSASPFYLKTVKY